MAKSKDPDWDPVRALAHKVLRERAPLELTPKVISILRRSAREVAIGDDEVERALRSTRGATALLRETYKRITRGWDQLGDALLRMYDRRDAGDIEGALEEMRGALAEAVVPFYRQIAASQLELLERRKQTHGKPTLRQTQPRERTPVKRRPRRTGGGRRKG